MSKQERGALAPRIARLAAAGAIASAMCAPAAALADATFPSAGDENATSATTVLKMRLVDDDEYGVQNSNIRFSVPSALNFAAKSDGTLIGPSESAAYLKNLSSFSVRASSMDVDPESGWSFATEAEIASPSSDNSVSLSITPGAVAAAGGADAFTGVASAKVEAANFLEKGYLADPTDAGNIEANKAAWTMAAADAKVNLRTEGRVARVTADISAEGGRQFGTIKWYVTPGEPEQAGRTEGGYTVHHADGTTSTVSTPAGGGE